MGLRIAWLLLLLLGTCTCAIAQTAEPALTALVKQKLGDSTTTTPNFDSSFHLCTKAKVNADTHLPLTHFIIVRAYDWKVVEEGLVTLADVVWSGDYEVEVKATEGQVRLQRNPMQVNRKIDLRKHLKNLAPK
ncbi:MAG: hypothetical protein ACOYXA_01290 [Bacteroidota bacterium]